jgi:hypothetical protein
VDGGGGETHKFVNRQSSVVNRGRIGAQLE